MKLLQSDALQLLNWMLLAREGDRREGILLRQGKGHFQLPGEGHEAIAALAFHLRKDDLIFPAYRDRALIHSRGMTVEELARDFLGREGGPSRARNLPGHFSSRKQRIFSITSPVGAQCLPAVGAAWGMQRSHTDTIVLCHVGDAATRQGEFYEAVCFAIEYALPILFVIEDNGYGISTPTAGRLAFHFGVFPQERLHKVNGRIAEEVYTVGGELIERTRQGGGPSLLWCDVDRLTPHTLSDDQRIYRSAEAISQMQIQDPLALFAESLIAQMHLTRTEWQSMQQAVQNQVRDIYAAIEGLSAPSEAVTDHLLGSVPAVADPGYVIAQDEISMLQAIQRALRQGLESFPEILLFGQDIEDPKGGVFGMTKGLSHDFPNRVLNSPLAEATILGVAVGMAATGHRPVFEFQFIDFIGPAFNQIVSQLSNLRWRTGGDWQCPAIFYAPCGAYLPAGGMWHSQSGEGLLSHIPGLRIVMPSTPHDVLTAFWTAFHLEDPTFILLPKHLFHVKQKVHPWRNPKVAQAHIVTSGNDVTVVAWGNTVAIATRAVEKAGVSADIIDLCWLMPWDRDTILHSLTKTGRLVIVQEDMETGSLGASILASLLSEPEQFYKLVATPRLVSRPDAPIPFCAELENSMLPNWESVASVLAEVVSE